MTKGTPWTVEEEIQLNELIKANTSLEVVAAKLGRQPGAILMKCQRLGLEVRNNSSKFDALRLPEELPTVEEALKMLAGALKAAAAPVLSKADVHRLQVIANLAKTYKEIPADYIDYRGIEENLKEMEAKYIDLFERMGTKNAPISAPDTFTGNTNTETKPAANST